MDRLVALLEDLPLPEIARLLRRCALSALVLGTIALVVAIVLNHPLVGLGAVIGLGLGLANIRLVTGSVAKVAERQPDHLKRVLASRTVFRLGATTVIILALAVASTPLGLATAGGVAVFYLLLVAALLVTLLRGAQAST